MNDKMLSVLYSIYKKYPMYDIIDQYVKDNKIICGGNFILNLMFDSEREYGAEYRYELYTDKPFALAINLSNHLAENKIYNIVKTITPHRELHILYDIYPFPLVMIHYSSNTNSHKLENGFYTYPDEVHLAKIYYNLADISMNKTWEHMNKYIPKLTKNIPNKFKDFPYAESTLRSKIMDIFKEGKCIYIGESAYNLYNNKQLNNIEICTEMPLDLLESMLSEYSCRTSNILFYDKVMLNVMIVKDGQYMVKIYNLLSFLPIFIKNNIPDTNIILFFLYMDIVILKNATYIPDKRRYALINNTYAMIDYFQKLDCVQKTDNPDDYIGYYEPPQVYKRNQNIIKNIFLNMYDPQDYYKTNGEYRNPENFKNDNK